MKMNKVSPRQVLIALAIAVVIYLMFVNNTKSMYSIEERMYAPSGYGAVGPSEPGVGCEMKAVPASRLRFSQEKLLPKKISVNLPQKISSRVKTSSNHVPKLVSQKPSVVLSETRTNKSALTHPTQKNHLCGTTPLSPLTLCVDHCVN